ncbi:hypothetical protein BC829DRAFT_430900 [Chytridium lagenaria]|nr:hypothetical protein BC829DRAFT_430900 [Chytridium lagenaria]
MSSLNTKEKPVFYGYTRNIPKYKGRNGKEEGRQVKVTTPSSKSASTNIVIPILIASSFHQININIINTSHPIPQNTTTTATSLEETESGGPTTADPPPQAPAPPPPPPPGDTITSTPAPIETSDAPTPSTLEPILPSSQLTRPMGTANAPTPNSPNDNASSPPRPTAAAPVSQGNQELVSPCWLVAAESSPGKSVNRHDVRAILSLEEEAEEMKTQSFLAKSAAVAAPHPPAYTVNMAMMDSPALPQHIPDLSALAMLDKAMGKNGKSSAQWKAALVDAKLLLGVKDMQGPCLMDPRSAIPKNDQTVLEGSQDSFSYPGAYRNMDDNASVEIDVGIRETIFAAKPARVAYIRGERKANAGPVLSKPVESVGHFDDFFANRETLEPLPSHETSKLQVDEPDLKDFAPPHSSIASSSSVPISTCKDNSVRRREPKFRTRTTFTPAPQPRPTPQSFQPYTPSPLRRSTIRSIISIQSIDTTSSRESHISTSTIASAPPETSTTNSAATPASSQRSFIDLSSPTTSQQNVPHAVPESLTAAFASFLASFTPPVPSVWDDAAGEGEWEEQREEVVESGDVASLESSLSDDTL